MKSYAEVKKEQEARKEAFYKELAEASPERKRELFLKHNPFAAYLSKHRDSVKIKFGG